MAASDLLIDGYNLLHAAGYGRVRYAPGDLQRARQRLLKKLFQLLTPAEIAQAAVVFDAKEPPPELPRNWYINGLRVMYAQPHGDADEMLEQLIDEHSAPKQLTVVSSDHRLHRAAKRRRATAIDSDQFLEHLERRQPREDMVDIPDPAPDSPKATGEATSAEVAYWMSIFSDVMISDLGARRRDFEIQAREKTPTDTADHSISTSAREKNTAAHNNDVTLRPAREKRNRKLPQAESRSDPTVTPKPLSGQPALFSKEWIDDLQRWVDGMQK